MLKFCGNKRKLKVPMFLFRYGTFYSKRNISERPLYGGIYNELGKSIMSLCSADTLAEFTMSLQNL
jgi:hypothetical protein